MQTVVFRTIETADRHHDLQGVFCASTNKIVFSVVICKARSTVSCEPNNITTLRPPKTREGPHSIYTYEMTNPPSPTLSCLLTPCIPSSSGLSTPTFGAGSQSGYDGETPHVLQRAIMHGEDVPESPIIDRDAGTDFPDVSGDQGGFAG